MTDRPEGRPSKGTRGLIMGFGNHRWFRIYHHNQTAPDGGPVFDDYQIVHHDFHVILDDDSAHFFETESGTKWLDYSQSSMEQVRLRADNWTPPANNEEAFWVTSEGSETCEGCGKHIRNHYGSTEYRCEPKDPPKLFTRSPDRTLVCVFCGQGDSNMLVFGDTAKALCRRCEKDLRVTRK